mmetsp:Transcript_144116/g.461382  ORF Transcript_144116/g.461382 Transcript_144116/m.461382 type:complete len:293 (-) Transcript_144116:2128-3006(-)
MGEPSLDVESDKGVDTTWVIPIREDLVLGRELPFRDVNRAPGREQRLLDKCRLLSSCRQLPRCQAPLVQLAQQPPRPHGRIFGRHTLPASGEEEVVCDPAKEILEDAVLPTPLPALAVQVIALGLAREAGVVGRPLLRLVCGLRVEVPRLPIDLAVKMHSHAIAATEAINLGLRRHLAGRLVTLCHSSSNRRLLLFRHLFLLLRPLRAMLLGRIELRPPGLRVGVPLRKLQPLQVRPRDMAGPPLGFGRVRFVATDLFDLKLALVAQARHLLLDVRPPIPAQGVALLGRHEV